MTNRPTELLRKLPQSLGRMVDETFHERMLGLRRNRAGKLRIPAGLPGPPREVVPSEVVGLLRRADPCVLVTLGTIPREAYLLPGKDAATFLAAELAPPRRSGCWFVEYYLFDLSWRWCLYLDRYDPRPRLLVPPDIDPRFAAIPPLHPPGVVGMMEREVRRFALPITDPGDEEAWSAATDALASALARNGG